MKQNKWKSNEANDKSLTRAEASVERRNGETESLLKKKIKSSLGCEYLLAYYESIIAYSWRVRC